MSSTSLDLIGNAAKLRVSASDVAAHDSCARFLALKIRPDVKSRRWRRSLGSEHVFVLGLVAQLVLDAHFSNDGSNPDGFSDWLDHELERRGVHRLLRPYAAVAVTNVLEAHWDIEAGIGPLQLIQNDPWIGQPPRTLWVWGPLYSTANGVREIRRYRLGSAHAKPDANDLLWVQTAARIAADFPARVDASRIRVVEVGVADGSLAVVFDDTPAAARTLFAADGQGVAAGLGDLSSVTPGSECANCKVAGTCEALVPVPEVLGQTVKGYATRSVAPSDLDRYRQCPAQWLLASDLHLPRNTEYTESQTRGLLVHMWLEAAHERRVGCSELDLPVPGGELGLAASIMNAEEYSIAYPYLRHHISTCPLNTDAVEVVEVESSLYGFDAVADVVTVTKPDLIFRIGSRLVIREFKTSSTLPANGADESYIQFLQVPFLLSMLSAGFTEAYGATEATVEVEILTADASEVYAWDADDPELVGAARRDVAVAAGQWHTDSAWNTHPGPHCAWCPVRQWCPDRDTHVLADGRITGPEAVDAPTFDTIDDAAPF